MPRCLANDSIERLSDTQQSQWRCNFDGGPSVFDRRFSEIKKHLAGSYIDVGICPVENNPQEFAYLVTDLRNINDRVRVGTSELEEAGHGDKKSVRNGLLSTVSCCGARSKCNEITRVTPLLTETAREVMPPGWALAELHPKVAPYLGPIRDKSKRLIACVMSGKVWGASRHLLCFRG